MPRSDPSRLSERELPEWLQREVDEIARREARDRLRIALAAVGALGAFALATALIIHFAN